MDSLAEHPGGPQVAHDPHFQCGAGLGVLGRQVIQRAGAAYPAADDRDRELKKLAASLGATVGDTVALAVRRLRQDQIGADLRAEPAEAETAWLDADLG